MSRRIAALFVAIMVLALPVLPAGAGSPVRLIVQFDGALPGAVAQTMRNLGAEQAVPFEALGAVAVTAPRHAVAALSVLGGVRAVTAERRVRPDLYASVEQIGAQGVETPAAYVDPDDEREYIRPGVTGDGQVVAVVDTGVWAAHPDLSGAVLKELNFELAYGLSGALTQGQRDLYYETTGRSATLDGRGHGTQVAGIIAGDGRSAAGRENHGVAPGASIVSLKVGAVHNGFTQDVGWERNVLAAYDWLVRHHRDDAFAPHGIRVVNNSWSLGSDATDTLFGDPGVDPVTQAVDALVDKGLVVVFSAGNGGTVPAVPNGHQRVITVAATCKQVDSCGAGELASFSSTGPQVDVAAPGHLIMTAALPASYLGMRDANVGNFGSRPEEQARHRAWYRAASGTSMAAAHVSGVVALMLEVNPTLSPAQVHQVLTETAEDFGPDGFDEGFGHGQVATRPALIAAHRLLADRTPRRVPGADEVWVEGFAYRPRTRTVVAGTTVTWTNKDSARHTATSGQPGIPDGTFDVNLPGNGGTGSFRFDTPGTYSYYCRPHPNMTAEIVVTAVGARQD